MIYLVGNKSESKERKISFKEGKALRDRFGFHYFCETSASTGLNINEVFETAAKHIYLTSNPYTIKKPRSTIIIDGDGDKANFANKVKCFVY